MSLCMIALCQWLFVGVVIYSRPKSILLQLSIGETTQKCRFFDLNALEGALELAPESIEIKESTLLSVFSDLKYCHIVHAER